MSRQYEALLVFNTQGKQDTVDTMISKAGKEMEGEGARLESIDHMGIRKFPYNAQHLSEGYYVSVKFNGEPSVIEKIQSKLRLNADVHLQHYQRA